MAIRIEKKMHIFGFVDIEYICKTTFNIILHVYKALGMDVKSEFAYEGQKLGQRSLSAKMRKYVLL